MVLNILIIDFHPSSLIYMYVIYMLKPALHAPNARQAEEFAAALTKKAALYNNLMIRAISFTIIRIF